MTEFHIDRVDSVGLSDEWTTENSEIKHDTLDGDRCELFGRFGGIARLDAAKNLKKEYREYLFKLAEDLNG